MLVLAILPLSAIRKEAPHGNPNPSPRRPNALTQRPATVPLGQLWNELSQRQRQELLGQLTRILAQQLAPPNRGEEADE